MTNSNPTCAVLLIGDELLSGRTEDANLNYIAKKMTSHGVDLKECRIVADELDAIIPALNELRAKYTYVFTTGGIGPTHDDITVEAVAYAFGLDIYRDESVVKAFHDRKGGLVNENTLKMADFPVGSTLIPNNVSVAPGFNVENVYSFAGIPSIMRSMLDGVMPTLESGAEVISKSITSFAGESRISDQFEAIQNAYPHLSLGSYPSTQDDKWCTTLVVSGKEEADVAAAFGKVVAMIHDTKIEIIEIVE